MTANQIIAKVDELEPNQYSTELKLSWLSQLDGQIFEELILTHLPEHHHHRHHWKGNPLDQELPPHWCPNDRREFVPYETGDEELIAQAPYGERMYIPYLQGMIAAENSEVGKYNVEITRYNSAYLAFANWVNRHYMPSQPRGGSRFRF